MSRREFSTCLNREPKIYNCSIWSFVWAGTFLIIFFILKGFMWGLGAAGVGFGVGKWLSRQWFIGQMQRKMYWYLPCAGFFIDKNCPESHERKLM